MRWMLMGLFGLGFAPTTAMAGQTSTMSQPFPSSGTVFEVSVEAFNEKKGYRHATLKVTRIWGPHNVTVVKEAIQKRVLMENRTFAIGDVMEGIAYDEAGFDDEGNGLVLMKTEGEIEPSTLKKGERYLYVYPNEYFEPTPALIEEIEKTR